MNGILVLVLRLTVILLGYSVAVFAASAFFVFLIAGPLAWTPEQVPSAIFAVPVMLIFAGCHVFLPACVAIVVTEFRGKRDWLSYALAGAMVGIVAVSLRPWCIWHASEPGPMGPQPAIDSAFSDPGFIISIVGCGIVGGIAYWLVAGRRAGLWRKPVSPTGH